MIKDNELIKKYVESVEYSDSHDIEAVYTYCRLTLTNKYELIGTSVCFNPVDYEDELGKYYAFSDALRSLYVIHDFLEQERRNKEQESGE